METKPKFVICNRCKKKKIWPIEFTDSESTCTICSNYIRRTGMTTVTPESQLKVAKDWRKRNPDKVKGYNKLKREKEKLKDPEEFKRLQRERMQKCRDKKRALKVIEKEAEQIRKDRKKALKERSKK